MTMSHLLRRTKKCCLKLFRKLSINNDQPTSNNNRLSNSRTTKYLKHKSSKTTTTTKRRKITTSSPKFKSKKLKSYMKEDTSSTTIDEDEDDDDGTEVTKDIDKTVQRDKEDNENNNPSNSSTRKTSQPRTTRRTPRVMEYKHRNCCSNNSLTTNYNTNNINSNNNKNRNFFGFNKEYLKNHFNFHKQTQKQMISKNLGDSKDKNLLNNDFYLNKMFDDDNIRFTDNKIYIDKNSLKACCSKIQFNSSNTNSNNSDRLNNNEIIFEKVIFDKNKKYLSHSPTVSVVPSPAQSFYDNLNNDNLLNNYKNDIFIYGNKNKSITSLYDNHTQNDHHHFDVYDPWMTATPALSSSTRHVHHDHDPSSYCKRNSCTLTSESSLSFCSFDNDAFGDVSSSQSNYKNEYNSTDPWSAFDLNSLDLKTKSNSLKVARSGRNFDSHGHGYSNNHKHASAMESDGQCKKINLNNWCNNKISSSTLETWIDDEVFDNSFNEELEKRCAIFEK